MTKEQIAAIKRDYDRDGFVILRGFVQGAALDELRRRATDLSTALFERDASSHGAAKPNRSHPEQALFKKGGAFRNVFKNLQRHDAWFDEQLNAGKHVPLVRALVGDELVPATAAWFTKRAGSAEEIGPHRDSIGKPEDRRHGATIWIALDPADPENGCLYYGRGSHKLDDTSSKALDEHSDAAVAASVQPGDAVIHSSLTIHWSRGNPTARPRRAVSFFYWGAGASEHGQQREQA